MIASEPIFRRMMNQRRIFFRIVFVARSSLAVTFAVWKALFLREAVTRLSSGRAAWLWLLFEPIFHVSYLMFIFTVVRVKTIGGIATAVWIMVGMLAFFMFRRTATQASKGISSNQALFSYRQIKPVDCVLVRAGLELFVMTLVAAILFAGAGFLGLSIAPDDPLMVLVAFFGMWLTGLGFGLISSVATEMVPEFGKFIGFALTPLYLLSGVIFPISAVPQPYQDWLVYNPLVHGLEAARLGVAPYYHAIPGLSITYLYACALVMILFGLALHQRFQTSLVTK